MSGRAGDGDYDWEPVPYQNGSALYESAAVQAIYSRRGRKALAELREALLALPRQELVLGALCRRAKPDDDYGEDGEVIPAVELLPVAPGQEPAFAEIADAPHPLGLLDPYVAAGVEGVCAVGAYLWWKKVKAGVDPVKALQDLPELDTGEDGDDAYGDELLSTAYEGRGAGLAFTLAWELASANDETFADATPAERHAKFIAWIDEVLASPPLRRGETLAGRKRIGHTWTVGA